MTPFAFLALALAVAVLPINMARTRLHTVAGSQTWQAGKDRAPRRRIGLSLAVAAAVMSLGVMVLGWVPGVLVGVVAGAAAQRWRERAGRELPEHAGEWQLAAGWDLLAAAMRAGLPVPISVRAAAAEFSGVPRRILFQVADLLVMGADARSAWEPALQHRATADFARAARRTARSGSGLADVAADLAGRARGSAREQVQIRAQRASVWITAPLGLCFLPAFLCLGVAPIVAGMVHRLGAVW